MRQHFSDIPLLAATLVNEKVDQLVGERGGRQAPYLFLLFAHRAGSDEESLTHACDAGMGLNSVLAGTNGISCVHDIWSSEYITYEPRAAGRIKESIGFWLPATGQIDHPPALFNENATRCKPFLAVPSAVFWQTARGDDSLAPSANCCRSERQEEGNA